MHTYCSYDSGVWIRILTQVFQKIILLLKYADHKENQQQKNKNVAHDNMTPNDQIEFLYTILYPAIFKSQRYPDAPRKRKYAVQSTSNRNRGSASLEAVCIMPVLLFAFWAFYSIGQIYILENQIYQAAMNTAGYFAESAYLEELAGTTGDSLMELSGYTMASSKLREYLPRASRVEQYVTGGRQGLILTDPVSLDEEGFLSLVIRYQIQIPVPFLNDLSMPVRVQVRQKAYTGYRGSASENVNERYVYLAEYSSVYHLSRSCSHLKRTIVPVSETMLNTAYSGLAPCDYCGSQEADTYFITETGDCYHTSNQCTGLKRTVRRVRWSEAAGYAPCTRCGADP